MAKLKCRNANCDKVFTNASNRLRHEKKVNHVPEKKKIPLNFDEESGWFIL